jgi:hypothetical protein
VTNCPDDPELLHPEAQRVRMQAQTLGRIAHAVDPPAAGLKHLLDVHSLH